MPNFVSFAASIAELAHGEKSYTQSLNHPAYLMPWEPTHLRFGKITSKNHYGAMITGTGVFSVFHGILPTTEPIWHHRADCSRPCSQQKQMTGLNNDKTWRTDVKTIDHTQDRKKSICQLPFYMCAFVSCCNESHLLNYLNGQYRLLHAGSEVSERSKGIESQRTWRGCSEEVKSLIF